MGFRFRKSINLGGGFRINLSKSGIGYSFGTKGMRWTKLCNGRNRSTYSIPGTGLAYISESSDGKKQSSSKQEVQEMSDENGNLEYQATAELEENNAVYDDFIQEVSNVKNLHAVWNFAMFCSCITTLFVPPVIFLPILLLIGKLCFRKYFKVELNYNFDEDYEDYFSCLNLFLSELAGNQKLWGILKSYHEDNTKYSSGASSTFARTELKLKKQNANYLNSNVEYYCLEHMKNKFYFLPDRLLIDSGLTAKSLRYSEIQCKFDTIDFVEELGVTSDTEVIENTWKYTNKDGSPDRRFKDNYQIPICRYGTMQMQSNNGLDMLFHFSNCTKMPMLKELYDSLVVKRLNFTFEL
ncbi:MAG: DUF4236 domain-containing protein [Clostridia bacterium]|nr:DUF4236 domain-containing protein [Clostridia bacterium]